MKQMRKIRIKGCDIDILPVVRGLVSEEDSVVKAFDSVRPNAVAISISKEQLDGLRSKESYADYELSDLEIAYAAYLESFGEVRVPPPCYVKVLDLCEPLRLPLIPIDMNEDDYSQAYCDHVRTSDLFRESYFAGRVAKISFDLTSPTSFVLDWDRKVNKAKGFRVLEDLREGHMATTLTTMSKKYQKILAVVELERAVGVERHLQASA